MNCPKCERELVPYARFCGYCGERLVIMCHSCEVLNPPDGLFCYNCGTSLTQAERGAKSPELASGEAEQRQAVSVRCPRCETVNEPGSEYCYKCGLPLEGEQPPPPVYREARPRHVPPRPRVGGAGATPQASITGEPAESAVRHTLPVRVVSLRALANWTTGLLIATCVLSGWYLIATVALLDLVSEHGQLARLTSPEFAEAQDRVGTASTLLFWVCAPTVILFLVWMHRASENLRYLGALGQRFSPGWAAGGWFIPILNLFRPYQVMAEIWKGSAPDLRSAGRIDWKYGSVAPLLGWWWVSWVASCLTGLIALFVWAEQTQVPSGGALWWYMLVNVLMVGYAFLAILIVRRVTAMQEEKHERMMASAERW